MKFQCKECRRNCSIEVGITDSVPNPVCVFNDQAKVIWNKVIENSPKPLSEVIQTKEVETFEGFIVPKDIYNVEIILMDVSEGRALCGGPNVSNVTCVGLECTNCICSRRVKKETKERFMKYLANYHASKKQTKNPALPKLTVDVFKRGDCPKDAKIAIIDAKGKLWFLSHESCVFNINLRDWVANGKGDWTQIIDAEFDASDWQNSIIKRPIKKTIRPWTFEEAPVSLKVIRKKAPYNDRKAVLALAPDGYYYVGAFSSGRDSFEKIFKECVQLDGSPCGVEVDE